MPKLWDVFCKVVDNYGDIGVCWRLCADLASRGERVRLWVDDAQALQWMAPQGCPGVEIRAWTQPLDLQSITNGDVLVEAFGCNVAPEYIANYLIRTWANGKNSPWINLEYLSAEDFVEKNHGLPSPVLAGPAKGLTKHFFYPGFTSGTGGLLREPDLLARQAAFDLDSWLRQFDMTGGAAESVELVDACDLVDAAGTANAVNAAETIRSNRLVSLFCYEPPALDALLQQLACGPTPTRLLVAAGRPAAAVRASLARFEDKKQQLPTLNINNLLSISYLPWLTQGQFDELLWACDLNFVRGEDSLVRAIWAGKPFVWQIYPQHDGAHHAKLNAFLDMMAAPTSLRQFSWQWNAMAGKNNALPALDLPEWNAAAAAMRNRLLMQTDLTTQLIEFVNARSTG